MIDTATPYFWIASVLALLLFLLLAFAEFKRYGSGGRLYIRLLLLLFALGALFMVFLKPTYQARGADTTILLNRPHEQRLDSLLDLYPAAQVLSLQPHRLYPQIEGLSYLNRYAAGQSRLFVVGDAFTQEQLPFLQPYQVIYLPNDRQGGVLSLNYKTNASTADTLLVQGSWFAPAAAHKLLLSLGSQLLDSVSAEKKGGAGFVLKAPLPFPGRRVYRLYHLGEGGDTLATYHMPLQVQEPRTYRMALLTAYPEAETKYIKELLRQQAYELHYVAQLSPGIAVQEWLNLPQKSFTFSPQALREWDVLLLSAGYYAGLGRLELEQLQKAVWQHGTGLMLLADEEATRLSWQGSNIQFSAEALQDTLQLGQERVPVQYRPLRQVPEGWQVLLRGEKGIAAIGRRWGLGQLVVSGITATYPLVLKGKQLLYEQFWSHQLQQVLPPVIREATWQLPAASAIHLPLALRVTSQDSLPQLQVLGPDQQALSLTFWQTPGLPMAWKASFWPREPGWYTARTAGDTLLFRVAMEAPSLLVNQQQEQLRHVARLQEQVNSFRAGFEEKPLSEWLFFVLFLTGMGGLWLEKKLNG